MLIHYDHYKKLTMDPYYKEVKAILEDKGSLYLAGMVIHSLEEWWLHESEKKRVIDISKLYANLPRAFRLMHCALYAAMARDLGDETRYDLCSSQNGNVWSVVSAVNGWASSTGLPTILSSTHIREVYHLVCFHNNGEQVLAPSLGLSLELAHTTIQGLRIQDVLEPYPSFYVLVPEGMEMRVYNELTGWHKAEGIYLARDRSKDLNGWQFMIVGKSKSEDPLDNALFYSWLGDKKGTNPTIEEACNAALQHFLDPTKSKGPWPQVAYDRNAERWADVMRWLFNVVFYVTSTDAEVDIRHPSSEYRNLKERLNNAKGTKAEKLKERMRSFSRRKYRYLGNSIKRTPGVDMENKVVHVPGHWQHYWEGKGEEKQRIRKRKRPYFYGKGEHTRSVLKIP